MRSRDRRTKRGAAFRRGGIYAPKAFKEALPPFLRQEWGECQNPNYTCKFLLSTFMVSLLPSCPSIGECAN